MKLLKQRDSVYEIRLELSETTDASSEAVWNSLLHLVFRAAQV